MTTGLIKKSILNITGDTASDLLDGLITQNIKKATVSNPIYALFLNNRGRVLFSTIIYMIKQNSYAIEIEDELLMDLAKHIYKYDLTKKVEFSKNDELEIIISNKQIENTFEDPRSNKMPYRGLLNKNLKLNHSEDILTEYNNKRLENTIPENYDFIREKSLANDLNIEILNGVDFKKGCYLGQEITSKTKHIRETKNQLVSLKNNLNIQTQNTELFIDDIKIGETFSFNDNFILAIIKRSTNDLTKITIK